MDRKITVIGIGTMGRGIALALAMAGYEVSLVSRRGVSGYEDFIGYLQREIRRGRVPQEVELNIRPKVKWSRLLGNAIPGSDFVIETVVEDEKEKKKMLQRMDELSPEQVILASNTSSLSINALSAATRKPHRFIGLHFFNPAHIMKLVEVVPGEKTSKETVRAALDFVRSLGKTPILVKDAPGFVVNRILFPMINQAICCLCDGDLDAKAIDGATRLGANLPMGPLALSDYVGLDVCLSILENLYNRTGNMAYKPCHLLRDMVVQGHLGRKTGRGFFQYT